MSQRYWLLEPTTNPLGTRRRLVISWARQSIFDSVYNQLVYAVSFSVILHLCDTLCSDGGISRRAGQAMMSFHDMVHLLHRTGVVQYAGQQDLEDQLKAQKAAKEVFQKAHRGSYLGDSKASCVLC